MDYADQATGGSRLRDKSTSNEKQHHQAPIDDASMHTITASSMHTQRQQQQSDAPPPLPANGNSSSINNPDYDSRPATSYSDTGFSRPPAYTAHSQDNTPESLLNAGGGLSRPPSTQQQAQQYSSSSEAQAQQSGQRQAAQKNSSVVIKVGMVGDAQIGKTSLMVKYVEGSWDEDYIQTLGKQCSVIRLACPAR